jgi:hypothetical protein
VTAANPVIGILVLGLVIWRQLIPRRVRSNLRIMLILAVVGPVQTAQYLNGRHIDATIVAEIIGSLVLAAVFDPALPRGHFPCSGWSSWRAERMAVPGPPEVTGLT